jgi:glycosyltransferase involved in cell wall biosynthesis
MTKKVFVYDPTFKDKKSAVRGVGRYVQILRENFSSEFEFVSQITDWKLNIKNSVFINPFFNFLQSPLTLKRIAHQQIAIIHDLIPLKYPSHFPAGVRGNINILLNKFTLRNYDLIITDSETSKKDIINILHIHEKKIKVIYPCLPKIFTNLEFRVQNSKFCIYVGDATWNKNLVNLAYAIKIANINCVFVGAIFKSINQKTPLQNINHPWMTEFKQFIKMTKDDKRFIFAGFITDFELIKLYQQALFNILPSRDEGFGFSYLEAAHLGCPSLLSDIPVLQEISAGNALFIDPKDPQNIADKIKEIDLNKILKNKINVCAKKRSQYFSQEKFKKEFLSIL